MVEFVVVGQSETRGPTRGSVIFRKSVIAGGFTSREAAEQAIQTERLAQLSDRGGANVITREEFNKSIAKKPIALEVQARDVRRPDIEEARAKQKELTDISKLEREKQISKAAAKRRRDTVSARRLSGLTPSELRIRKERQAARPTLETFTPQQLEREKAEAFQERARATRRTQLRAAGAEVIQQPSERAFGVLSAPFETKDKGIELLSEKDLAEELKSTRGFVTFKSPVKVEKKNGEIITTRKQLVVT